MTRFSWQNLPVHIGKAVMILVGLMLLIVFVMIALGKFHIAADTWTGYGIYDPAAGDLPSHFNPLIDTIMMAQLIAILLLPVVLFFLRKRLKVPALPWLIVPPVMIAVLWFVPLPATNFNPMAMSELPLLIQFELVWVTSVMVGMLGWAAYLWGARRVAKD